MKFVACLVSCGLLFAQDRKPPTDPDEMERQELSQSLAEAGTSPIDFLKALEKHLEKFPQSKQKAQIERAAVKSAIEAKDNRRIVVYGERVLNQLKPDSQPDDMEILDRVTRSLLEGDNPESSRRAFGLAVRLAKNFELFRSQPSGRYSAAQWAEQMDRGLSRAYSLQARALGNTGKIDDAGAMALKAWITYPTAESAREAARWLAKLGKNAEAVEFYAAAFTIEDPQSTETERGKDRIRMGELYAKNNASDKGLGDIILRAYDRTSALMGERLSKLKLADPNASATQILDFTLQPVSGEPLPLSQLKGNIVVMDFWATWCGPCRVQHPMIEKVKEKFAGNKKIVFLSVNSDEDRAAVAPFLKEIGWKENVFFESGLSGLLKISSIPTVVILDPAGQISSKMMGFIPERFPDMLTERIKEANAANVLP